LLKAHDSASNTFASISKRATIIQRRRC
jgi:hypothetical protein